MRRLNRRRIRKTRVDVAQRLERSDHEGRAHDQHERAQRDLHDDQKRCASRSARGSRLRRERRGSSGCSDVQRVLERRDRTEHQRRCERDDYREDHGRIEQSLVKREQASRPGNDNQSFKIASARPNGSLPAQATGQPAYARAEGGGKMPTWKACPVCARRIRWA